MAGIGISDGLLPRSGIGVEGPHLVIAPPGNPTITLDARLLDGISLVGRSSTGPYLVASAALGGVIAGSLSLVPGGLFVALGFAYVAGDRFVEAKKRREGRDLLLSLGSLEVALHVADGPSAANRISELLSQYTRNAPISRPEVYEDAKRRLRERSQGRGASSFETQGALKVGDEQVRVEGNELLVGKVAFAIDEVRDYALRGANLPLPGGRLLQAALGLLLVAAVERARKGEDVEALRARIAVYEAWTGRHAGR